MTLYKKIYRSPVGDLSLVADKEKLLGVWFVGQKYFERGLKGLPKKQTNSTLKTTVQLLDDYFLGKKPDFSVLPLSIDGSPLQKKVWTYLQGVKHGDTVTYGTIAENIGVKSPQAVGSAVGRNPFTIIIPCHRVLGKDGGMTGYAGGTDKKVWLLKHELFLNWQERLYQYSKCTTCMRNTEDLEKVGTNFENVSGNSNRSDMQGSNVKMLD